MNNLSERLNLIANLVIPNEAIADIGTDHGFVPIHLLEKGTVPFAVLSDVNQGPVDIAATHLKELNIDKQLYSLRCGDGLEVLQNGEVSTVIIAGMGGELIEDILNADLNKTRSFKRFVLQPRTHSNELRHYLSCNKFEFEDYRLVKEKFRICEIFVVKPTDEEQPSDCDLISRFLLEKNDPLIESFIDYKIKSAMTVLASLEKSKSDDIESQKEVFISILNELTRIKEGIK